jgi:hypothetical protein
MPQVHCEGEGNKPSSTNPTGNDAGAASLLSNANPPLPGPAEALKDGKAEPSLQPIRLPVKDFVRDRLGSETGSGRDSFGPGSNRSDEGSGDYLNEADYGADHSLASSGASLPTLLSRLPSGARVA